MELNNIQKLQGKWKAGWALDVTTTSSEPPGTHHEHEKCGKINNGQLTCCCSKKKWVNHYNGVGAFMHLCKYHQNMGSCQVVAAEAIKFLKSRLVKPYLAAIIPVPPSNKERSFQPVYEIAKILGEELKIKVDYDYLLKIRPTSQLKSIVDPEERRKKLAGVFQVKDQRYADKKVLLFDDVYDTGATINEITQIINDRGHVNNVYVLAVTKTRTKK